MLAKKVTALLVSAALVLALLAGCGGGQQSVARTLLNLLDGKYTNVSVEMDSELEADLRQAVRGAETKAEIRAALENILGPGISFQLLGDGQKGDTAWNLILYPGSDPDAAGRSGFVEWNKVFSALPKDGQYTAQVAMIETDNGYALLVQATVDRAGSRDDDNDDDEPEEPKEPYKVTVDESGTVTAVTVGTSEGLNYIFSGTGSSTSGNEQEKQALETARNSGFEGVTITLSAGQTYTVDTSSAPLAETFKGTLTSEASKAQITLSGDGGYGLFNQIETGGTVENIRINVKGNISQGYDNGWNYFWAGAVAGYNKGTITGCHVTIDNDKSITGDTAGGIVGWNENEISDCTVTGGTIQAASNDQSHAGGIVGYNKNGTIEGSCTVKDTSVSATSTSSNANAGGLVGQSYGQSKSITVNGCYTGGGTISATSTSFANAGGLVGNNGTSSGGSAKVTGSYTGRGTISATSNSYAFAGGLVGHNSEGTVSAIYSGSSQIEAKAKNANGDYNIASVVKADTDTDDNAFAGTGIGYDQTKWGPVAATELPWPKT
ncbi:GLUG motif-containing protein [Faecalibacterium sp. An192]|uniref:GLUG motif-containing protein n=1 Tax=Faecalibacterium sp. An192 TaxID=1965581 RepID=UPI000B38D20D|nr:GLUG motif-containing protein [Faecalibacterium sp. An192]OUP26304.1 hypothetical protein B5F27_13915 [Faecalibacterium sp. An192]